MFLHGTLRGGEQHVQRIEDLKFLIYPLTYMYILFDLFISSLHDVVRDSWPGRAVAN